jgi:hypothetical protein
MSRAGCQRRRAELTRNGQHLDQTLEQQGQTLERHGEMLTEILRRLPARPE